MCVERRRWGERRFGGLGFCCCGGVDIVVTVVLFCHRITMLLRYYDTGKMFPVAHCMVPCTTVYITPLGRFFELDCSTTKRAPIPNETPSESSRGSASNADYVGHQHYSNCGDVEHGKSAQGCVVYTVVYVIVLFLGHGQMSCGIR